jgi:hypothetical protein
MSEADDDKNPNEDALDAPAPRRRKKSESRLGDKIDIGQALEAPVRVISDGEMRSIDPYEAMLRQQVRKSIVGKSVPSIKFVLAEAEKHNLIKEAPPAERGGVFVVPKDLPEEVQRRIFQHDESGRNTSMLYIIGLLLRHITFERLKRCFNGR